MMNSNIVVCSLCQRSFAAVDDGRPVRDNGGRGHLVAPFCMVAEVRDGFLLQTAVCFVVDLAFGVVLALALAFA